MSERLNKIHLIICTIAATIIAIGFIAVHVYDFSHGLFTMAMWVSITIVLFYFIGHLVRAFLINQVFELAVDDTPPDLEESGETEGDGEILVSLDIPEDTMVDPPEMLMATQFDEGDFETLSLDGFPDEAFAKS